MKKTICALFAAVLLLGGCSFAPVQRGLDASSGAFVSSARPAVSVIPAKGFSSVSSGAALCRVPVESAMINGVTAELWYSLFKKDSAQLVTMLAECSDDWQWNVGSMGMDYRFLNVLYEYSDDRADAPRVVAYVRSAARDPWVPQFQPAEGGEGSLLVARYEWLSGADQIKLVAEYREPVEGTPDTEQLTAFLERAQASFTMAGAPEVVQIGQNRYLAIADRLLAPVVGAVTLPVRLDPL